MSTLSVHIKCICTRCEAGKKTVHDDHFVFTVRIYTFYICRQCTYIVYVSVCRFALQFVFYAILIIL